MKSEAAVEAEQDALRRIHEELDRVTIKLSEKITDEQYMTDYIFNHYLSMLDAKLHLLMTVTVRNGHGVKDSTRVFRGGPAGKHSMGLWWESLGNGKYATLRSDWTFSLKARLYPAVVPETFAVSVASAEERL